VAVMVPQDIDQRLNKSAMDTLAREFLDTAVRRLRYYKELGEKTIEQLDEEGIHWQPGPESNSIAVIIQHLAGNMLSRWTNFLTEDGEKTWRDRDGEFEVTDYHRKELMECWDKGWNCFLGALQSLEADDLVKTVSIRGESLTIVDAINRQLAHYPYHIGQIVYVGRMRKKDDWKNLSIPKNQSRQYNAGSHDKDPAKRF
jgi:Protein of unknown function (DUF1572)